MENRDIQRLAAATITPDLFEDLAAHGEDLLVERKGANPSAEKLGAEVASMANMLGGWVLLGVNDKTRKLEALALPPGIDMQSHIGNLLRKAVDPVPPFLADTVEVDGLVVGFVRVFQSFVVILVSGNGAVYTRRDAGGKLPVSDHRALLELAGRGRQAEDAAARRAEDNNLTTEVLGLSPLSMKADQMLSVVRAAPLTVTPQLAGWPVSDGVGPCHDAAEALGRHLGTGSHVQTRPFGRGVACWSATPPGAFDFMEAVTAADCVGVIGAAARQPIPNVVPPDALMRKYIRPLVDAVADLLQAAEAFGDSIIEVRLICSRKVWLNPPAGRCEDHPLPGSVRCERAPFGTPADDKDRQQICLRWERELARTAGLPMWETG
jgi:Putative DNA-binding domain